MTNPIAYVDKHDFIHVIFIANYCARQKKNWKNEVIFLCPTKFFDYVMSYKKRKLSVLVLSCRHFEIFLSNFSDVFNKYIVTCLIYDEIFWQCFKQ